MYIWPIDCKLKILHYDIPVFYKDVSELLYTNKTFFKVSNEKLCFQQLLFQNICTNKINFSLILSIVIIVFTFQKILFTILNTKSRKLSVLFTVSFDMWIFSINVIKQTQLIFPFNNILVNCIPQILFGFLFNSFIVILSYEFLHNKRNFLELF